MIHTNTRQQKMQPHLPKVRPLALLLAVVFGVQSGMAYALDPFDIAQSPLLSGGGIEPNLIYIHDDSSSMQATIALDMMVVYGNSAYAGSFVEILADRSANVYLKSLIGANGVVSGAKKNPDGSYPEKLSAYMNPVLVMNYEFNPMWYNPAQKYDPPTKGDGEPFLPSNALNPWNNGYILGADGKPHSVGNTKSISPTVPFPLETDGGDITGAGSRGALPYHYAIFAPEAVNEVANNAKSKGLDPDNLYPRCDEPWPPNTRNAALTKAGFDAATNPQPTVVPWLKELDAKNGVTMGLDGKSLRYNPNCYMEVTINPKDTAQLQNYANWFSYYRTREMVMKAGISSAFSTVGAGIRLGYGRLNGGEYAVTDSTKKAESTKTNAARTATEIDTKTVRTLKQGVRPFRDYSGHPVYGHTKFRSGFFDWLYRIRSNGNTPSREAINSAGQYLFENYSDSGPWSNTPGVASSQPITGCRKTFTILASDGGWLMPTASASNPSEQIDVPNEDIDGTAGDTVTTPEGGTMNTYSPSYPFKDSPKGLSNTLADVAMYYWKTDLLPDVVNQVPATSRDPAIWQHMTVYAVGLGVEGGLPQSEVDRAFKDMVAPHNDATKAINWGNPHDPDKASNPAKIDDMIHAAVNARGAYFSARSPEEFRKAIEDILATIIAETAATAGLSASSGSLNEGTTVFQGRYDTDDWSGQFLAYKVCTKADVVSGANGCATIGAVAAAPVWDASTLVPAHGDRKILSWRAEVPAKPAVGVEPEVPAEPGRPIQFYWDSLAPSQQAQLGDDPLIVDYLRGDTTHEASGLYRMRNAKKLGDIVNSAPAYVGAQDYAYGQASGLTATQRSEYRSRKAGLKSRTPMVYVGANDGMLHGFDATSGEEAMAYVPASVYGSLKELASPAYAHRFFVDASPKVADAYLTGKGWHTVLVGSTGAGGRSYFALDVEDPEAFSGPNPENNVLWEHASDKLGVTFGQASIVHANTGKAVAIFGNGYNSVDHIARLIILDLTTGEVVKELDTPEVTVSGELQANGLSTPVPVDLNGDGLADIVYAGDMQGSLWRFDISSSNPDAWSVGSSPLFYAEAEGRRQPITARPAVRRNAEHEGIMVYVGTGQFFEIGDQETRDLETFYGVLDNCPVNADSSMPLPACSSLLGVDRNSLAGRTFNQYTGTFENDEGESSSWDVRVFNEGDPVDYAGGERGFYIDLIASNGGQKEGERVISPALTNWSDRVVFSTLVPSGDACAYGSSQWIMEIDPFDGGRTKNSVFDLNKDGKFDASDFYGSNVVNGRKLEGGTGGSGAVVGGDLIIGKKDGSMPTVTHADDPTIGRQSWRQIR